MHSFYSNRYANTCGFMTGGYHLEPINMGNKLNKEYFIHGMANMGCRGNTIDGKPISQTYVKFFHDEKRPCPEQNSWMSLFDTYQTISVEMKNGMKGIYITPINDIMKEIVTKSTWDERFDKWFCLPMDYLTNAGAIHISEIDRDTGEPGKAFTTRRSKYGMKIGYREMFNIPRFGEVYCETKNEESSQISDILIAVQGADTIRYYAIMMCNKLPAEIFGGRKR